MSKENIVERRPWQPGTEESWVSLQVKRRFDITLGKMLQNTPSSASDCEVPYLKAQHVQWDGVRLNELPTMWASPNDLVALRLEVGDLLVCEGGEVGRAAILREEPPSDCIIQNALHRVRPRDGDSTSFLSYLLRHAATQGWFEVLCNRSTISHFTVDKFGEMWIALPDSGSQRAIADYLDWETAQIDALVAAKERLLSLLAEKRRALITRTVTRGLDPHAPLRESGVAWLGEIPAHWEVWRSKRLFSLRNERAPVGVQQLTASQDYGVIPQSEFVEREGRRVVEVDKGADILKQVEENDFVISMRSFQGGIELSRYSGAISSAYVVLVPTSKVYVPFFARLFKCMMYIQALRSTSSLVRDGQALRYENFNLVDLPLPSYEEQQRIAAYLDKKLGRLDELAASTEHAIGLLKERRSALIAAAVTGQMQFPEIVLS